VSLLGTLIFFISEYFFEQIRVVGEATEMPLESWQYSLCIATPEVLRSIGKPIYASGNPAYKIHFYIIAVAIIITVLNVIYGFSKMFKDRDFSKKRFLIAQGISVLIFIGLCILACFTAFYRNGSINISPLSAGLMTVFFIIFGITAGIYSGSLLHSRNNFLSHTIPAITASLTTLMMYIGELILMGGVLFRYGKGLLFEPIPGIPFSVVDIVIVLASGMITYFIMKLLINAHTSN
jgi:hypothetical protein